MRFFQTIIALVAALPLIAFGAPTANPEVAARDTLE
ncbi:hypothetical protein F66182_16421, partial [Fusarium sp. NRRL 66182]